MNIFSLIPDPEVLLGLAPEEIAYQLLLVASRNLQNGLVHRDTLVSIAPPTGSPAQYHPQDEKRMEIALLEGLHWFEVNAFLLPAPGINGANGHRILGRRANELIDRAKFDAFRRAAAFPKSLLHPAIADRVWISLARGELSDAVFIEFRSVEEAVRSACGYSNSDIGVPMMRRAFHRDNGPSPTRIRLSEKGRH